MNKTYMRNVNMEDDPHKEHELDHLTNQNADETEEGSDVENILGSVHISKPSIQHVFFLLKPLINPVLKQLLKVQTDLDELVNMMRLERIFVDRPVAISQSVPYVVDYKQRKFLYLLCMNALTLVINGNNITTTPGKWTAISYPVGTSITASGVSDASPIAVTVRATDNFGYDQ